MLEIVSFDPPMRVQFTAISGSLQAFAAQYLSPQHRLALRRIVESSEVITVTSDDFLRLIELVTYPSIPRRMDFPLDERGNIRALTIIETNLSLNPFFTEAYALDELDKVVAYALKAGILEPSFLSLKLTFHDVPGRSTSGWTNARNFIGDELYPRLAKKYYKSDRLLAKVYTRSVEAPQHYLHYRRRFLEPSGSNEPTRRGRREITPLVVPSMNQFGILSPSTELARGSPDFTVPTGLVRRMPGKLMFLPPSEDDEGLQNWAERKRRKFGFPFVAGPSGSMAYDLAVYHYYLEHARGLRVSDSEFSDKMLKFGVSRAIAYVKYGHHSFYESLVPLMDLIGGAAFEDPDALYRFIVPYVEMGQRSGRTYSRSLVRLKVAPHVVHWDSYLYDWYDWRSYKPGNYKPWTITKGPLGLNGGAIAPGRYIYVVLATDRTVRYLPTEAHTHEQYRSHSQLAGGLSVYAAGYFEVGLGDKLVEIDNSSGHYKPDAATIPYAVMLMEKLGFDIEGVNVRAHVMNAADIKLFAWALQQAKTTFRISIGWVKYVTRLNKGRTRSFPTPPSNLLQYMPY